MSTTRPIFAQQACSRQTLWESHETHAQVAPAPDSPLPCADALIAIIEAPLAPGETSRAGYDRKEREIAACLLRLDVLAARKVSARLAASGADDRLTGALGRLSAERRVRLQNLLAGARRRAAIRQQVGR